MVGGGCHIPDKTLNKNGIDSLLLSFNFLNFVCVCVLERIRLFPCPVSSLMSFDLVFLPFLYLCSHAHIPFLPLPLSEDV